MDRLFGTSCSRLVSSVKNGLQGRACRGREIQLKSPSQSHCRRVQIRIKMTTPKELMNGFLNTNLKEWRCLFNYLALFVRQSEKKDAGASKPNEGLDWQFIYETAELHRVLPFLTVSLKENGGLEGVPEKIRSQATASLEQAEWQNQVKMLEFNRIQRMFESQLIPIIPLKGIALTAL